MPRLVTGALRRLGCCWPNGLEAEPSIRIASGVFNGAEVLSLSRDRPKKIERGTRVHYFRGAEGGEARTQQMTPEEALARKAAKARWVKRKGGAP